MKTNEHWVEICGLDEITPNTGVAALVENEQIAIFRVGQAKRVYALSNYDPFSQANVMSRGILGDIQHELVVASPIYKQHFSLLTGRCLEDSSQKLKVYPSKIILGRVWVCTEAQKTLTTHTAQSEKKTKLVLVGNGLVGMRCLEDLLELAADRYEICVIGEEAYGNYNRIMLSPVLSGEKSFQDIMLHSEAWYQAKNIQFIKADPAVKIDRSAKQVHTVQGQVVDYDRLIIATGSKPYIPNIPGRHLKGVLSFRDIHDVNTMLDYAKHKQHAVVIGGGLLGLEAAYGLKKRGMQVTVIHLAPRIMNRQLDAYASELLKKSIQDKGIRIITHALTEEILADQDTVQAVRLASGEVIPADLVVFAVGIRPNIQLAQQAGLACQRGILVNDCMQTFDPSIYAVGECTEYKGQNFGLVEPLWAQAFVCATQLAEHGRLSFKIPVVPTRLKVSGCDVFSAGNIEPEGVYEDVLFKDEQHQIYKRLIIQNQQLIGAILFGEIEDGDWYAELIAHKTNIKSFKDKILYGSEFALKQLNVAS